MKKMMRQWGISLMLVCLFALAKAQDRQMPPADVRASKMTEWMKTNLNLTADQVTKVQDLNLKFAVKMDSLKNSSVAKENKRASMKSDGQARDTELKTILTEDQYKIYEEKKKEMKGKYKDRSKAGTES